MHAVLQQFGITDAVVRRLGRGEVNDLWRVRAGDDLFVLKRTHPERLPLHTAREHTLLHFLGEAGWSVPAPMATVSGQTIVLHDDRTWWLSPWLPGRRPVTTERSIRRLGVLLAELHRDLAPLAADPPVDGSFDLRSILAREVARHGWTFAAGLRDLERVDAARGERLRGALDRVVAALGGLPAGPTVVNHGDLHTGNLLVHRGTTSVIDFDFTQQQERAADIATSICLIGIRQELAPLVVAGYESVTPLDAHEVAAIGALFDARLLHHASWLVFLWSQGEDTGRDLDVTLDRLGTCGA